MTNIMKRENGTQPASFGSVVDQLFQKNLSRFFDDSFWGFGSATSHQQAPVNIRETAKSYEMELIVPGLNKQDIKLNVTGDTFTVSFEQKQESKEESRDENWIRHEFRRQSFTRSFNLDDSIDAGKISARYENGVLFLSLPKKENAQKVSRTVEVK